MNGLVPAFGIDMYAEKLERMLGIAPGQMAVAEDVILFGLGLSAALLILVALFRRSALAVVGFSLLALTGLVCASLLGRLDFVPPGTMVLVICLFACSILLFLTATIRVARENPFAGAVVLIFLAALLVLGGGSALNLVDGEGLARLGLTITIGFTLLFVTIEVVRGDKPSLIVAPGLLLLALSPAVMAFVGHQMGDPGWTLVMTPMAMLAGGAFYSALAAQFAVSAGAAAKRGAHRRSAAQTAGGVAAAGIAGGSLGAAVPLLREIEDDVEAGDLAPPGTTLMTPPQTAYAPPHNPSEEPETYPSVPEEKGFADSFHRPVADRTSPSFDTPARQSAPLSPPLSSPPLASPSEPVSAQWGSGAAMAEAAAVVADDEYVWDMMADREVKMGSSFSSLLGVEEGRVASPDVLRDGIASQSLDAFDEALLGGAQPTTGRFDVELTTQSGSVVRLEGRRQVDNDGLLMRLELCGTALSAAPAIAPVIAAATAVPLAASNRSSGLSARRQSSDGEGASGALDRGNIETHFQPIVRLSDRKTVGFEALARWRQPNGELLGASRFVDDLIKSGRGLDLARLTVEQAATELAAWVVEEPGQGQFVSVNISATDLPKEEVAEIVKAAVNAHGLPPGALVVELTEDRIQASQSKAMAAAKAVRAAGASLAIDDFGVGYSTLSRLSKFKFDLVKLDRSVAEGLPKSKKQRSFVKAILSTAKKSKMPVIAEGIEDEDTARVLEELGCDFGQGYLFGAAEPIDGQNNSVGGTHSSAATPGGQSFEDQTSAPLPPSMTSSAAPSSVGNLR
ncbi:MAG: EAL domain-containing protein [Pseudomonadota bacterium]